MANNEYINRVDYGNETLIDISDTTAEAGDVLNNKVFYAKSGARSVGSLGAMTGATSQNNGAMGLVPAPTTSDISKFLCGDGTWATPVDTTYSVFVGSGSSAAAGLVPAPSTTAGTTKYLREDGTWVVPPDTTYSVMTGATSSVAGSAGLVPAPTTGDVSKFLRGDGTWESCQKPMVVLSYGSTTWDDALAAYLSNAVVYCRASSNSNPATGSQTRMAFLAYVNDASSPTEFEFQYYRSVSSHSANQMGDEIYVYKFNKTNGWSVTKRLASLQKITGTGITVGYTSSTNVMTLTNDVTVSDSLTDTSTTKALSAAKGKALQDTIGNTSMGTTATTLTGAIAEVKNSIPSVINNLSSTSTTDALSAAQGKSLSDQIRNIGSVVRLINTSDLMTDISSNTTLTLDRSVNDCLFIVLEICTQNPATSGSHGVALIPCTGINNYAFYGASAGANDGHLRIYASGTTIQFVEQSINTTLYIEDIIGIVKI